MINNPVLSYYYNGNILTMNHVTPTSPHMLVSQGRVLHCDPSTSPLGMDFRDADFPRVRFNLAEQVQFVDLQGKTVIPGICDSHAHFIWWGTTLVQVDLSQALSDQNCIELVHAHTPSPAPGEWIIGFGWAHNLWSSRELPNREILDKAFPDNPVLLSSKCGHLAWINSAALQAAALAEDTADPAGGEIERRDGRFTGILKEKAIELVSAKIGPLTDAQRYAALTRAQAHAHALGITSMHTPEDLDTWEFLQKAHAQSLLSIRVNFWIPVAALDDLCATRTRHGLGDHRLRISAVKVFMDGSLGGRTALMYDPYENEPENFGIVVTDEETVVRHTLKANRSGLSMAIHAIGDQAVGFVLTAYERAAAEFGTDGDTTSNPVLRNRIEHLQVFSPRDLDRIRALRPIASIQPIHLCADMNPADHHWGQRAQYAYACRTIADAGCLVTFGSDVPVESCNPFYGMYAAVTRNALDGKPGGGWYPGERLSLQEALEAYTINCATASGEQDVLGSLEAGKLADFVILPDDPFKLEPEQLRDMKPLATIIEGDCVYAHAEWESILK